MPSIAEKGEGETPQWLDRGESLFPGISSVMLAYQRMDVSTMDTVLFVTPSEARPAIFSREPRSVLLLLLVLLREVCEVILDALGQCAEGGGLGVHLPRILDGVGQVGVVGGLVGEPLCGLWDIAARRGVHVRSIPWALVARGLRIGCR